MILVKYVNAIFRILDKSKILLVAVETTGVMFFVRKRKKFNLSQSQTLVNLCPHINGPHLTFLLHS